MKDLYQVLGITRDASLQEVKKAYRALALVEHPDKGGNVERMGLIIEAYQTLSDVGKRHNFDEDWRIYQETDVEAVHEVTVSGQLNSGDTPPYSYPFRQQHNTLVMQFEHTPLIFTAPKPLNSFQSGMYPFAEEDGETQELHDVFTYIGKKTALVIQPLFQIEKETLALPLVITRFIEFLSGSYFGLGLITLSDSLDDTIKQINRLNTHAPELQLYEGIFEIVLMARNKAMAERSLIFSLNKITNFAKTAPQDVLLCMIPLFYNPLFCNLYAQALHLYWQPKEGLQDPEPLLSLYDGLQDAKEFLVVLKERLSSGNRNEHLTQLIRYVKLLYNFEKDAHNSNELEQTADNYREGAFHFLDWVPVFIEQSSRSILVNIFLQIGLRFQEASRLEVRPAYQMADEQLALKMYLTAVGIGHHATPDAELYATTHVLRYLSSFKFQDERLSEVILSLKKRTLMLADVFPFFEPHQSNIAFLRQENKALYLMRQLLHALVRVHEYNKTHPEIQAISHSATTILYQAYEACLKNWYQEEYNPSVEKQFRLDLMEELLFENDWTFLDVEQRLDSPWMAG